MEVIDHPDWDKAKKEVSVISALLTNKMGAYSLITPYPMSRYAGLFFYHDNKMFKRLFILVDNLCDCKSATIHVCVWLDEKNALRVKVYPSKMRPMLRAAMGNWKHFCKQICHHKTDIMTSFSIVFTGVP